MLLGGYPQSEVFVNLHQLEHLNDLLHERETEVTVLKDNPVSFNETFKDNLSSNILLPLAH